MSEVTHYVGMFGLIPCFRAKSEGDQYASAWSQVTCEGCQQTNGGDGPEDWANGRPWAEVLEETMSAELASMDPRDL
jgi:hypothetical protein